MRASSLLVFGFLCLACAPHQAAGHPAAGATDRECLLLRNNGSGVIGMDVGSSVPLANGRSMFLFGDTFYGRWSSAGHRRIQGAVHSSLALVDPSERDTCFRGTFATRGGRPAQLLDPIGAGPGEQVWPLGPALPSDGRVDLAFAWIRPEADRGLGFSTLGNGLATGVAGSPEIPVDVRRLAAPAGGPIPSAWTVHAGFSYLYRCEPGRRSASDDYPCVVGRAPIASQASLSSYRYFVRGRGYVGTLTEASFVVQGAPAFTVNFNVHLNAYLEVYIEPWKREISARRAPAPEGPFSEQRPLWPCTLPASRHAYCYAAFEHPELEPPDGRKVTLSYSTNSTELGEVVSNAGLYWPRLVTVDLARAGW